MNTPSKIGRPAKGKDEAGKVVSIRKNYIVASVRVSKEMKARLEAAAFLSGTGVNEVIRDAIDAYFAMLPASQREAIDNAAKQANSVRFTPTAKSRN